MGGCTNCKGKPGCDDHKGSMMGEVERTLEALYPSRTWGEVDDREQHAMPADELSALAEELAQTLNTATFVRPGGDDEACDYLYVLCLGRTPCLLQVRDFGVEPPAEWEQGSAPIRELYLRLVISHRAHMCAVQQVAMSLHDGVITEAPRAGVYDAPLLKRMQKLVATLPAYDLLHIDFGEIAHPPNHFDAAGWPDAFGAPAPAIANYLFYPQPTTMVVSTVL